MKPTTERPEACAIDGKVHVFVGGYHQVMSVEAAETLTTKISDAVAQAKASASEEQKA
ncbi:MULTISPECIES: hypothetical protein [Luteibacter]|uniref:hypothetical protein n=1 Tax=Luteibacter TaxID=242605 RepID=UPI000B23222C|nr:MULTISPECIES: hypothetical protein [unclassified Luteibacter]